MRLREQLAAMEREHDAGAKRLKKRQREDAEAAARAAAAPDPSAPPPQLRRRTIESLDAELDEAAARKKRASAQTIGGFEQRLESSPQREQEYQADHARLLGRQGALRLAAQALRRGAADREHGNRTAPGERFRVLEPALPPEGPSAPNRLRLLIMGLLLALRGRGRRRAARASSSTPRSTRSTSCASSRRCRCSSRFRRSARRRPGAACATALATVSALALIALVATSAAYLASGNDQLVRLIAF